MIQWGKSIVSVSMSQICFSNSLLELCLPPIRSFLSHIFPSSCHICHSLCLCDVCLFFVSFCRCLNVSCLSPTIGLVWCFVFLASVPIFLRFFPLFQISSDLLFFLFHLFPFSILLMASSACQWSLLSTSYTLSVPRVLPANASRAFLMSSALRMLLIAISAVGEKKRRKRKRGGQRGDKVKIKVTREQRVRDLKDILVLHWWRSGNGAGNQDTWEGEDEWQSESVAVEEEWHREGGEEMWRRWRMG